MSYRDPKKNYDLFSALSKSREQPQREIGIMKLKAVIDWEWFRPLMEDICGYSQKNGKKGGRPPFDPILILKVLILQKYYGLSDEKVEFEINHRISKVRVRVELIFGRMSQMGAEYCRSIGLKRAKQHNSLANLTYNIDRYAFLMRSSA